MPDVVINGTGKLGQMVFHLIASDRSHRVVAFTADRRYCTGTELLGVPLIPFDRIDAEFPPDRVEMLTALGGLGGWEARRDLYRRARAKGYSHLNYVHPSAVVQGDQEWGENNIVFPFTTIGFSGRMGDNNVVREKVYLGHDHVVGDHVFVGVGCTVGGGVHLGSGTYLAMSSTVRHDVGVGEGAFVGIGSLLLGNAEPRTTYYGHPARMAPSAAHPGGEPH